MILTLGSLRMGALTMVNHTLRLSADEPLDHDDAHPGIGSGILKNELHRSRSRSVTFEIGSDDPRYPAELSHRFSKSVPRSIGSHPNCEKERLAHVQRDALMQSQG